MIAHPAQVLVHALAGRPYHGRQVLLRELQVDRHALPLRSAVPVGQVQEALGEAAGDVEEDRVLDQLDNTTESLIIDVERTLRRVRDRNRAS